VPDTRLEWVVVLRLPGAAYITSNKSDDEIDYTAGYDNVVIEAKD